MAAAYAALVSLQHIIETIQKHHASHLKSIGTNPLIETVRRRASSLQDFLEGYDYYSGGDDQGDAAQILESRIADAAYAAEDILESCVVDRILVEYNSSISQQDNSSIEEDEGSLESDQTADDANDVIGKSPELDAGEYSSGSQQMGENSNSSINHDFDQLEKVAKDMEVLLIEEEVKKMMSTEKKQRKSAPPSSSSTFSPSSGKNTTNMVGFDEYLNRAMEELTGQGLDLKVIPIFGMGGVGKTTLAKNVLVNPLIVQYFDLRAWVTISQEYSVREILSCLLREINGVFSSDQKEGKEDELGRRLRKELYNRRYLIILDDMWSVEAWEKVKFYFPDNNNGSRVVITTRLSNLASHFGSISGFNIELLGDDKSWNLLSQKVFGDAGCLDPELVKLGKKIAKKCKGLPLSIITIAGLLAKSDKTQKYWEQVLENLNSIVALNDNEHCLKLLSLSYIHLPVHLKPCFLYMGVFPEDYTIHVSKLIKLWVAEGFLKPKGEKSLEEVGEECLHDLIARNLISVQNLGSRGKIKTCTIHDLLRELSLKESLKEKFLCASKAAAQDMKTTHRRLALHLASQSNKRIPDRPMPLLRSLTYDSSRLDLPLERCRLLRVVNSLDQYFRKDTLDHQFNSRYLGINLGRGNWVVPSAIHLFWNLETVNIVSGSSRGVVFLPVEIWKMPQLKHLKVYDLAILPGPPPPTEESNIVLENIQTISTLIAFEFTEEVITRIPNIKKLKVMCNARREDIEEPSLPCPCLHNLDRFHKLESIFISLYNCGHSRENWQQTFNFPIFLKKLFLNGGFFPWESVTMIGALPSLEVLKLWNTAFCGDEWNAVDDGLEFRSLKFLEIRDFYYSLKHWNVDETCFPCLERLELRSVHDLVEIPMGLGDIQTLESIYVEGCKNSVLVSAKKILEEQRRYGNDSLQVLSRYGPISLDESHEGSLHDVDDLVYDDDDEEEEDDDDDDDDNDGDHDDDDGDVQINLHGEPN